MPSENEIARASRPRLRSGRRRQQQRSTISYSFENSLNIRRVDVQCACCMPSTCASRITLSPRPWPLRVTCALTQSRPPKRRTMSRSTPILFGRVRIVGRHNASSAEIGEYFGVRQSQCRARPPTLRSSVDASDENVRAQPSNIATEHRHRPIGANKQRQDVESPGPSNLLSRAPGATAASTRAATWVNPTAVDRREARRPLSVA